MYRHCFVVGVVCLSACGGGGSSSAPSATTTSIAVAVPTPIRMGQTGQATGTATMSNGQSQALTAGWLSDAPGVATVTTAGLVSALANGRASIYIVSGGKQGQQALRVVPDYHGAWRGGLRVTSCTASGAWADADACDEVAVNSVSDYSVSLDQSGESMTAGASYGDGADFPPATAAIGSDGTSSFTTTATFQAEDITATIEATFAINSLHVGELTGTVTEVWRLPNIPGELHVGQNIVETSRTGTTPLGEQAAGVSPTKRGMLRRLRR